jgi:uncharacterized membrane protein
MLTGPSSVISLIAEVYLLYIFAGLSRKLGNVTKMQPYYRGFYAAIVLIVVAIVAHSLRLTALASPDSLPNALNADSFYLFAYYLPMAVAATISLIVAWRYWGWLFRERER